MHYPQEYFRLLSAIWNLWEFRVSPFQQPGLFLSIKPENIFGVVSSPSTCASSGHMLLSGDNLSEVEVYPL